MLIAVFYLMLPVSRNRLSEISLSHLMKVALEAPEQLSDNDLEQIVNIWNRKCKKISV